jgi:hypothetical protein
MANRIDSGKRNLTKPEQPISVHCECRGVDANSIDMDIEGPGLGAGWDDNLQAGVRRVEDRQGDSIKPDLAAILSVEQVLAADGDQCPGGSAAWALQPQSPPDCRYWRDKEWKQ